MILDACMLSDNIMDYFFVAQGKTSIPGVDDGEECTLTDVRNQAISNKLVSSLKFQELHETSMMMDLRYSVI